MTASSSLGSEQADARGRTHRVHQEQCNLSTVQLFLEGSPSLYVQLSLYAHMECCTHSWFVFFARLGLCVVQRSSGHTVKCLSRVKKSQRKVVRECVQCLYDFFFFLAVPRVLSFVSTMYVCQVSIEYYSISLCWSWKVCERKDWSWSQVFAGSGSAVSRLIFLHMYSSANVLQVFFPEFHAVFFFCEAEQATSHVWKMFQHCIVLITFSSCQIFLFVQKKE